MQMRDQHEPSDVQRNGSTMNISGLHSSDKRKCSSSSAKGKKKLDSRSAISESIEKLVTVGNELIAAHLKVNLGPPSFDECMDELQSFGLVEGDKNFHLFALSFFDKARYRTSCSGSRAPQMKMKFLKFNYKSWCLKNAAAAFDD
ncbi:Uncharacterized protein Adt_13562 [Abeliophyllum distichum]|uniref:Uncharacterized protein n=1 Tax=Abeliophyllum distichum TaxID=126358 RepID=A0ABD1TX59_9LAMI